MAEENTERGVYGKYWLRKADGSPIDAEATYFVLRLDKDLAARSAALHYAERTHNKTLAHDLKACVEALGRVECRKRNCPLIWRHGTYPCS